MQLILIQIKISGRYAKRINGVLCIYSQLSVDKYGELDESELKQQLINKHVDLFKKMDVF